MDIVYVEKAGTDDSSRLVQSALRNVLVCGTTLSLWSATITVTRCARNVSLHSTINVQLILRIHFSSFRTPIIAHAQVPATQITANHVHHIWPLGGWMGYGGINYPYRGHKTTLVQYGSHKTKTKPKLNTQIHKKVIFANTFPLLAVYSTLSIMQCRAVQYVLCIELSWVSLWLVSVGRWSAGAGNGHRTGAFAAGTPHLCPDTRQVISSGVCDSDIRVRC